ncbi:hypothetical protein [Roseococcus pinisoli]|uniref:Uncharacterized protein n=1 Tax=Roseococcus pinisoli TaxID=2835040 RepID=A0ABS5QBR3_9PROT|nr:hypothetical protein [Roseococcus pinisoli]MBS7810969.1 hypothetical protein [Roseococcus pinisoli]
MNARPTFLWGAAGAALAVLAIGAAWPQQGFGCGTPFLQSESPDGRHSVTVCRQPRLFAMPGQGGDAPALVVLRDAGGTIEGAVQLSMLGEIGHPLEWTPDRARLPLAAEFDLNEAGTSLPRWLANAAWRWRSWLGLLPGSSEFR